MSPKIRQTIYYLGTIVPAVLGIALIWGGIDQGAADNLGNIIAGTLALLGAGPPAVAASKVKEQRKDGTFDAQSPADLVVAALPAVVQAAQHAQSELDRVRGAAIDIIGDIPVYGPAAQAAIDKFLPRL